MTQRTRKRKSNIKQIKKADGILSADWHITNKTPFCRTDDFLEAMLIKLIFIFNLSLEHECPIYIAGDVGDKSNWPITLLVWFLRIMRSDKFTEIICIPGQHDLPNHSLENIDKSGMGLLNLVSEKFHVITEPGLGVRSGDIYCYGYPFGKDLLKKQSDAKYQLALTHQLIIEDKPEWKEQVATPAKKLLIAHPEYKLIVSGDNHKPFVVKHRKQLLVNPGSLMRTRADQINHKPRVYLWYASSNEVEPVYLPINEGVVDRSHLEEEKQRENRVGAYVSHLKENKDVTFDFEENIEKELKTNRISKRVKEKVREAMK